MKYGETLRQRSIPEWGPSVVLDRCLAKVNELVDNIDYNEIKHLIKDRTTKGKAQALSIPGTGDEETALKDLEDEIFIQLLEQHDRIDLFVRSKSGEIERRLKHLRMQVAQLENRHLTSKKARISVRRLERFSKVEEDVLKAGEEVQFLSRFVGAQRLAFHKLLKKYKRWTDSAALGKKFSREILDRPTSFTRCDFEPLLAQWIDVLTAVRAPFKDGLMWKAGYGERGSSSTVEPDMPRARAVSHSPHQSTSMAERKKLGVKSSAEYNQSALANGSAVDFDTAVATSSVGGDAGKAVYWVHPDNLVQLQVLLLQYMKVPAFHNTIFSPGHAGSVSDSPSLSSTSVSDEQGESVGLMVFDHLDRFVESQRRAAIDDAKDTARRTIPEALGSARWCNQSEAIVYFRLSLEPGSHLEDGTTVKKAKLKRKNIANLFRPHTVLSFQSPSDGTQSSSTASTSPASPGDLAEIKSWLAEHDQVRPWVQIVSRRKRFVGLTNSSAHGVWAILDRDICMEKPVLGGQRDGDSDRNQRDSTNFPYSVLEVGWQSKSNASLVRLLDQSHLIERVKGFSLQTHAIAVLCKPENMPSPFWLSALDTDIRKVPKPATRASHQRLASRRSPESATTETSSLSATSTTESRISTNSTVPVVDSSVSSVPDMLQSPPISAFKKKRRPLRQHTPLGELDQEPRRYQQRYWNEFDDGSEASDDENYVLFVDPNAKSTLPGAVALSRFTSFVVRRAKGSSARVKAWLRTQPRDGEERPLLAAPSSSRPPTDGPEDGEASLHSRRLAHSPRGYSTFVDVEANSDERLGQESMLIRTYIGFFLASAIILAISAVLAFTGRPRDRTTVDVGVFSGVVAAVVFAVVGVGVMIAIGRDRVGWVHWSTVWVVFCGLCIAGSVLLAYATGVL